MIVDPTSIAGLITAFAGGISLVVSAIAVLRRSSAAMVESRQVVREIYTWCSYVGVLTGQVLCGPVPDELVQRMRKVIRRDDKADKTEGGDSDGAGKNA